MFTGMPEGGARFDHAEDAAEGAARAGERACAALAGSRFADVRWVATTGSTNADAMALARLGEREGIVVVADHQSAGRGRRDRTWVAPPGGSLLVSVLLRPPARLAGAVTMAAGVAMAGAVEQVAGVVAGLKWPNDLVVETDDGERKLAGILAEADWPAGSTASAGHRPPGPHDRAVVVVGVGLNVSWPEVPDELDRLATALNLLAAAAAGAGTRTGAATNSGHEAGAPDRVELLVAFLRRLDEEYAALLAGDVDGLLDRWRARSVTLGRRVRVDLGAGDVEGTALGVTAEGHLVVATDEGPRRTIAVGDVVHLRRA
jgi:BirA family transcriptional regulator, biotin operon repressor / biotin---[acetyl-CoA-carboxylase] ligase